MYPPVLPIPAVAVALLAEGVDRNRLPAEHPKRAEVALLAEGVDRNFFGHLPSRRRVRSPSSRRAWIEIGLTATRAARSTGSPSSRRAWIEISCRSWSAPRSRVALLAEGVDRNECHVIVLSALARSPSSRRAWIEIGIRNQGRTCRDVALLAEGVDRNRLTRCRSGPMRSRPPRGGRG